MHRKHDKKGGSGTFSRVQPINYEVRMDHRFLFSLQVPSKPLAQNGLAGTYAAMNMNLNAHTFLLVKDRVEVPFELLELTLPVGQPGWRVVVEENPPALKHAQLRQA